MKTNEINSSSTQELNASAAVTANDIQNEAAQYFLMTNTIALLANSEALPPNKPALGASNAAAPSVSAVAAVGDNSQMTAMQADMQLMGWIGYIDRLLINKAGLTVDQVKDLYWKAYLAIEKLMAPGSLLDHQTGTYTTRDGKKHLYDLNFSTIASTASGYLTDFSIPGITVDQIRQDFEKSTFWSVGSDQSGLIAQVSGWAQMNAKAFAIPNNDQDDTLFLALMLADDLGNQKGVGDISEFMEDVMSYTDPGKIDDGANCYNWFIAKYLTEHTDLIPMSSWNAFVTDITYPADGMPRTQYFFSSLKDIVAKLQTPTYNGVYPTDDPNHYFPPASMVPIDAYSIWNGFAS
jgi:hypothetical protein